MTRANHKPDPSLIYAILEATEERNGGPVFDLCVSGFLIAETWRCASYLIDQGMLTGNYGLSDTGAVSYLHIHGVTPKGHIILEQLRPQFTKNRRRPK